MSLPSGSTAPVPPPSFVPPSAEELGAMLPQYEISHLIATGGMGAVYAGMQRALDRPVAIKILPPDAARDGDSIGRFRIEAKAMARLIHPHIPAVYDFDVSAGYCYLVMEFIDGWNVHQLIARKELTPELTYRLLSQVCDALHFAHQRGIVHGDIKPSNLLVTQEGNVKLADFGLAQLAGTRESDQYASMGTPEYAAPELWQPGVVMDHRADLYSLGCVFYEMLTGAPPEGQFQLPAAALKLDHRVDVIIARCMQQKPDLRYQSAAEVRQALDAISQTGAPAVVAPAAPTRHAVRKVRPPNPRPPLPKSPAARTSGPAHSAAPVVSTIPRRRGKRFSDSPLPWLLVVGLAAAAVVYALKSREKPAPPPAPAPASITETPTPPEDTPLPPRPSPASAITTPPRPAAAPASRPADPPPAEEEAPPAPQPPSALSAEAAEKLNAFRAKYRTEWQIAVVEKRNAERERLSAFYHTALDKFREESAYSGDAAALLAVRNEADRFNRNPTGLPDSQLSSIEKLATLQKTLTTSFATAETRLKPAIDQLRESCLLELRQIQTSAAPADQETIGALYDKLVAAPDLAQALAD